MEAGDVKEWNPMDEHHIDKRVNSYRQGIGQDLQSRDLSDVEGTTGPGGYKPVVLYISNVPLDIDEIALQNIFEEHGKVVKVHLPMPSPEKVAQFNSKIGFVTMENVRGAQNAIESVNGFLVKGKALVVKVKQSKEELTRRKEKREREEVFFRSLRTETDNRMAAGPSSDGASSINGEPGAAESQRAVRSIGPSGDAASVAGNLSITVNQDSRRVQDHGGKQGLLPLPDSMEAAAAPVVDSAIVRRGPVNPSSAGRVVCNPRAVSVAGTNVGSDLCANCQRIASLRCQACRKVYYCNANCQRVDWPVHRRTCTYDQRVPSTSLKPLPLPSPNSSDLDIEINDEFLANNEEYLTQWIKKVQANSDSSSSSGDRQPVGQLQFSSKKSSKPNTRTGPGSHTSQQRSGQSPQDTVTSPQKKPPLRSGPPQQRQAGLQGAQNKDGNRSQPQNRETSAPQQGRGGAGSQSGGYGPRDRPETPRRDGQGCQQGWKGAPDNVQADRPRSFQPRNEPVQGDRPKQFPSRSGPQNERGNQPRNGPYSGKGNQSRNGPQEFRRNQPRNDPREERDNQSERGPQGEKPSLPRNGPQGKWSPGDRGDKPRFQRGENQGANGARGPPPNRQNSRPDQFSQRDGNRGGPRNDRGGPGRQQQERGNYRDGKDRKSGGGPKGDSWEEKTTAPPTPSPSVVETSPGTGGSSPADVSQAVIPVLSIGEPMEVVPLNTAVKVVVSHVENPQRFWVQMTEQLTAFVPFVQHVFAKYTGRDRPATVAEVGQLFLCEFMEELARAQVVSIAGTRVKIFYMDYGNSEEVQMSQLLPVPAELASLPPLSLPCSLMVRPILGGQWPAEVVTLIQELFSPTELCDLTVLKKQPAICEVTLARSSDGLDASAFLKEKGFGVDCSEVASPSTRQPASGVAGRVMKTDMHSVMEKLGMGQHVQVMLLDPLDPMHIFVHIASLEDAFNQFSTSLVTDYNSQAPTAYQPVVGEMVVGRFSEDSCWYRAEVLEVYTGLKEANLFFVDFGNKEQLPFTEIRALKEVYAATPIHGMWCALEGISACVVGQWQEEHLPVLVSCMHKYLQQEGEMPVCSVVVKGVRDGKVWVDMVSEDQQTSLSQELNQVLEGASSPMLAQPPSDSISTEVTASVPKEPVPRQLSMVAAATPTQLQKATLTVGECLEVGIQDIVSCNKFFINAKRAEGDLTVLREQLSEVCEGEERCRPPLCQSVSAGDKVLVKFTVDEQWYRGQVEQVSHSGTTCTVFFLDYGNKEDKTVASLRVITPEFLSLPAQAVPCRLAGLPATVSEKLEEWFLTNCLQTEAMMRVVDWDGDSYGVDILTADSVSVITAMGLQSPTTPSPCQPAREDNILEAAPSSPQCPPLEAGEDHHLQLAPSPSSSIPLLEVTASQEMPPSPRPPMEAEGSGGGSPQGASPQSLAEDFREVAVHALTRDCLPIVAEDGRVFDMVVTVVVSPAHFYTVHREHYIAQHDEGGLVPQLKEINATAPALDYLPAVGELLSGQFEGEWFRCEVLEIVDDQIRVIFFDYGNAAVLELSALRPLPRHLCDNYPLATVNCCLHGLSPANGDSWDEETVLLVQGLMVDQRVSLTIQRVTEDVHHVTATRLVDGEDVGQALIRSGKAVSPVSQQQSDLQREELIRQMEEIQAKLAAMEPQ